MTTYKTLWDNGFACEVFSTEYATKQEAWDAATAIEAENIAEGVWDDDCYAEVIEVEDNPEDEALVEGTLAYFDRYIAGDR